MCDFWVFSLHISPSQSNTPPEKASMKRAGESWRELESDGKERFEVIDGDTRPEIGMDTLTLNEFQFSPRLSIPIQHSRTAENWTELESDGRKDSN